MVPSLASGKVESVSLSCESPYNGPRVVTSLALIPSPSPSHVACPRTITDSTNAEP